ncbi:hypothetical protein ABLE68_19045 [Nocardioides sp. CN2-186]|uniref:hypothetical protein n=1 Tax=Nocardioides tweenelious TaxID=3156607 RepID=UPI0032B57D8C
MKLQSLDIDIASTLASPRTCPACGSYRLRPVSGEDDVVFTCVNCLESWAFELGSLVACSLAGPWPRRD